MAALCVTFLPTLAQAPGDLRVALVVGNAAYAGNAALTNPGNDAKAMGDVLRGLGFTVVEVRDGSKAQMAEAITQVKETLQGKQGVGMFYYAGHAMQLDWRNYMLPVDAKLSKASEVAAQTVDLGLVIDAFKTAGNRMNIVVLDACRDNPFASTSTGKGLAQLDAPPGTFLAYATAPGNVAEDGDAKSSNGLYTQFLLEELKKPAAKIEDIFKRVRLNVRQKSEGRQIPWESTSLEDDFYFDRAAKKTALSAQDNDGIYQLQLATWNAIKTNSQSQIFVEYLKLYPSGYFSEMAQFRLDQIARPVVVAQAKPNDTLANSTFTRRAVLGDVKETKTTFYENGRGSGDFINRTEVIKLDDQQITRKVKFDSYGVPTDILSVNDLMDNPISGPNVVFENPTQFVPAEYKLGLTWKFSVRRTTPSRGLSSIDYQARVAAREKIKVIGGEYEAFRVEMKGLRNDGARYETQAWIVPGSVGRIKGQVSVYSQGNRVVYQESTELVSFKAGV
jgi:Caspase domain